MPEDEITLRSGDGPTTRIGYVNANRQQCHGTFGVSTGPTTINTRTGSNVCNAATCMAQMAATSPRGCALNVRGAWKAIRYWLPDISPKAFKLTDMADARPNALAAGSVLDKI